MNERLLRYLLLGTGAFNINDYFLTNYVLDNGHSEGNPLMNLIVTGPFFAVLKLCIIPAALFLIWIFRNKINSRLLMLVWIIFIAYAILMVYFRIYFL